MEEKLKIKVTRDGSKTRIFLNGVVDEDSNLETIEAIKTPIIINFKNLTQMNSVGIRLFMKALTVVQDQGLWFEECTATIVRQMSMVPAFLGKAKVISIYAPYSCEECEAEKMVLLDDKAFGGGKLNLPTAEKCESCGKNTVEFDGNPAKYFAFALPK